MIYAEIVVGIIIPLIGVAVLPVSEFSILCGFWAGFNLGRLWPW